MMYTIFCLLAALVGCGVDHWINQQDLQDAEVILKEVEEVIEHVIEYDEEPYMPDVHKT